MKVTKWNGKAITKPGVYSGVPIEVYHSAEITEGPAVSSSNLRTAWNKSLFHMFAEWCFNPDRPEESETEETRYMRKGRAAHHLLLGEDAFSLQFVAQPKEYRDTKTAELKLWNNNATYCKAWNEKQREAGRTILKYQDLRDIERMARSMAINPVVAAGGLNGKVEHSMFTKDKETGLWLKWRPDVIPNDGDYVDLKVVAEIMDISLAAGLRRYGYHMQGGLGWEVCEQLGLPFTSFVLLYVEAGYPHYTRDLPIDDEDLSRGRLLCRKMLRSIRACMDRGHWPGPGEDRTHPLRLSDEERSYIDKRLDQ